MDIFTLILLVLLIILGLFMLTGILSSKCPKCNAIFPKTKIEEISGRSPKVRLDSQLHERANYSCRRCGHQWHIDSEKGPSGYL